MNGTHYKFCLLVFAYYDDKHIIKLNNLNTKVLQKSLHEMSTSEFCGKFFLFAEIFLFLFGLENSYGGFYSIPAA